MLLNLAINNVVLIERAQINFAAGLSVITGETGSGKSILLDALGLAVGFRGNLRLIGESEEKSSVAAEFDIAKNRACQELLQEHGLLENSESLRIRRVLQKNSAGKIYVNDILVGQNLLALIGETLVEICGQNEHQGLLNRANHRAILDEYAGVGDLLISLKAIYDQLTLTNKELAELVSRKASSQIERDYLTHSVKELEKAQIKIGEETELTNQKNQVEAGKKILNFLSDVELKLNEINSAASGLSRILLRAQSLINQHLKAEEFEKLSEWLNSSHSEIETNLALTQTAANQIGNHDEEQIVERLLSLRTLARKFDATVDELPQLIEKFQIRLGTISDEEELEIELSTKKEQLIKNYQQIAGELSSKRKSAAIKLAKRAEDELRQLKMDEVKFRIEVENVEESVLSAFGSDRIRFVASLNRKQFDEIEKIASGGELSRFMLALKLALSEVNSAPTIIFDEVDAGIGGATADAVGNRLKLLGKYLQVMVVTHQASIASKADTHYRIIKTRDSAQIKTEIKQLSEIERKNEVARMLLGDEISHEGLTAAEQMIKKVA